MEELFHGNGVTLRTQKVIQKGVTTATSGVLARFPWLLPVQNSFASYGASAVTRTSGRGHVAEATLTVSELRLPATGIAVIFSFSSTGEGARAGAGPGVCIGTETLDRHHCAARFNVSASPCNHGSPQKKRRLGGDVNHRSPKGLAHRPRLQSSACQRERLM